MVKRQRVKMSLKFDGLIFAYHRTYSSKYKAMVQAKTHRANDYKTRIIEVPKGWALYKR
jgi:hypothetical protein